MKQASKANLDILGLPGIFQSIADNRQTGTLRIESDEQEIYIFFREGKIQLIGSPNHPSILAEAIHRCFIPFDSKTVENLFARHYETGKSIATLLIEMNVADNELITELCRYQIREEVCDVFTWGEVHCEFTEDQPSPEIFDQELIVLPIDLNPDALMMEAARRLDEWELFSQAFPSMRDIPYLTQPLSTDEFNDEQGQTWIVDLPYMNNEEGEEALSEEERIPELRNFINLIDGVKDIEEIVSAARMPPFRAIKILYGIFKSGKISLRTPKEMKLLASREKIRANTQKCIKLYERAEEAGEKDLQSIWWLAKAYERSGLLAKAAEKYKELGKIYLSQNNFLEAISAFHKVVNYAPDNVEGYEELIDSLNHISHLEEAAKISNRYAQKVSQKDKKKAIAILEEANKNCPSYPENLNLIAQLYIEDNQKQNSVKNYEILAPILLKQNKLEDAVNVYRKILTIDSHNIEIHLALAKLFIDMGKYPEGIEQYKTLGKILHSSGMIESSFVCNYLIETCKTILKFEPESVSAREWLVDAYLFLNDKVKAKEILSELLALLEKKNDSYAFVMNLKKMMEIEPDNLQYRQRLAQGYIKLRLTEEAKEEYMALINQSIDAGEFRWARDALDAVLKLEPFNLKARQNRARVLTQLNLQAKAVEEYKLIGYMAKAIEQYEDAIDAFSKLLKLTPDKEFFVFWELAKLCETVKKNDMAVEYYKEFINKNVGQGNYGEALTACRRLLTISPNNQEVKDIKKNVEKHLADRQNLQKKE